MANKPGSKFRVLLLLAVIMALMVSIWLMGRILLNLSAAPRQVSQTTPLAATPAPPSTSTPTQPGPSPTSYTALSDVATPTPTSTSTSIPLTLSSRGDRLASPLQITTTAGPTATPLGGGFLCRVQVAPLELRAGPGQAYDLISTLADATPLSASKQVGNATWVLVETEQRQVGWVYGPCIVCQNDPASLPPALGLAAQSSVEPTQLPMSGQSAPMPTPTPTEASPPQSALSQDYWLGEYFDNASLAGQPVLVRQDPAELEFNWILDSPGSNVPADNFSVRWTRLVDFLDGGDFRFYAEADDGVRIYVDGRLIVDNWNLAAPITYQGVAHDLSPGLHPVTVEYFESGGYARIKVWGERGPLEDSNWTGQYYNNPDWQEPPVLTRQDDDIDFDWGDNPPVSGLGHSDFSIRWRRTVFFAEEGGYRFWADVDRSDRVKIYLDGWLLVDKYKEEEGTVEGFFSRLQPGFHTMTVEYVDDSGPAKIKFHWERD